MTQERLQAVEGEPVRVPQHLYEDLAREGEKVALELGLRIGGTTRLAGALRFDNMIGTIATRRAVLEIIPKTRPGQDWMASVLDLIDDRPVAFAEDVPAEESAPPPGFLEMIARSYAARLGTALALEGPITTIETASERSSMLSGRLRVEEWLVKAAWDGHRFPVDRQHLSPHNAFSDTLSFVGYMLAPHIGDPLLRRELLACVETLSHGREVPAPPPNAVGLRLPDQWGGYEPAWTIAQLVLRQKAPLGSRAALQGMSLAIEPWRLLERLLERTVAALASMLDVGGFEYMSKRQSGTSFLTGSLKGDARRLLPDCVLARDGSAIANFEAKYRDYQRTGAPRREESYQAITAGRALGTSLAVLVYPNAMTPRIFEILQAGHRPDRLAVVGLDMFGYRRGSGEVSRATQLRELFENEEGTCMLAEKGEAA